MINMVSNILDVAKLDIDELEIGSTDTNLKDFIHDIWCTGLSLFKDKNLSAHLLIHPSIPSVIDIDHYRLK